MTRGYDAPVDRAHLQLQGHAVAPSDVPGGRGEDRLDHLDEG